jgi:hypothetical protein
MRARFRGQIYLNRAYSVTTSDNDNDNDGKSFSFSFPGCILTSLMKSLIREHAGGILREKNRKICGFNFYNLTKHDVIKNESKDDLKMKIIPRTLS